MHYPIYTLLRRAVLTGAMLALVASAQAQTLTFTGTTINALTWNRPEENDLLPPDTLSDVGTSVHYSAQTFTVNSTGSYDILSTADQLSWDNYLFLYQGSFTPTDPLTNIVLGNDDFDFNFGESGWENVTLTSGTTYTLVTTGWANSDQGAFTNTVTPMIVTPEPGAESLLLIGSALGGTIILRRRRR